LYCAETKKITLKQEIDVLDWPSPDANPIENVWALMKFKL